MFHYLFKTYIANGREYYEFAASNDENVQRTKKDFPFPESLLSLLYLDVCEIDRITKRMDKALRSFYSSRDLSDLHEVESGLDELASKHICFELLRLEWLERIRLASAMEPRDILDMLPHKNISHIYSNIAAMQDQIKELIAQVLDTDSGKKPVFEKMADYYNAAGEDTLHTFRFQPQSMNFEIIDRKVFAEVFYPSDMYDLIDFHVRECIKREVKMHLCKNCLRYFVAAGNRHTEYCDRICDSKGRTCKEIGAMNTWTERKQSDEVFKEYRREYKKRFARITAGKLTKGAFYIWSEEARQKKEQCDNGEISHEEFSRWLRESI